MFGTTGDAIDGAAVGDAWGAGAVIEGKAGNACAAVAG